jgi:glycosyltransferase involved in cell wall biosynthesis
MRIGVIATSYPRAAGDPAGSFVAGLTHALAARGHELAVVAAGPGAGRDGEVPVARVPGAGLFYDEGAPDRLERAPAAWLRAPLFSAALLARVLGASRGWDAIVSHWLVPCGLAGAAAAALRRIPHLAVAHSADVHLVARPGAADAAVAALLAPRRTTIAFAGEHLRARLLAAVRARRLRDLAATRSLVCPMGIDAAALRRARAGDRAAARRRLGLPAGVPVVGALGRLVPVKGLAVLIDAAAALDLDLIIAGEGPLRAELAARARAAGVRAWLPGELRGAARDDLLAAVDVLALPSIDLPGGRTEGTPVVALEAMAAGVPLVASAVGGVPAAVGDAAWLVPPGRADLLAEALRAALADPGRRAPAGLARAAAHDWARVAERLEATLLGA